MSQFQNEAFHFHFVKSQVQTLSQSVFMATDLPFHFTCKLLHVIESFISSKSVFNYKFSSYPILKQEPLTIFPP